MKFCPKCGVRLIKADSGLECSKCDYSTTSNTKTKSVETAAPPSTFKVLDETELKSGQSTIKKECEKCGNDEAVWWMLQTRSADEPTTQFYRCTKCSYTWRDYS